MSILRMATIKNWFCILYFVFYGISGIQNFMGMKSIYMRSGYMESIYMDGIVLDILMLQGITNFKEVSKNEGSRWILAQQTGV